MRYGTIGANECSTFTNELAWKRSGFKNRQALESAVRGLPLEKKVEMLTEIQMREMAEMFFEEKQEFLLKLGHKTWVDADEIYEYAKETFKNDSESDTEWRIIEHGFHPVCVMGGSHTVQMNSFVMKRLKEKREGNKNE